MIDLHGFGPLLLKGALLSLEIALVSLVVATLLGMVTALARLSASKAAAGAAFVYTTVVRGVPELVMLLLVFYGGQEGISALMRALGRQGYVDLDPFLAGCLTLGLIYGAYMGETFRGAVLAVPPGQLESARAFGMTERRVVRRILLPQMVRHALPGFGNNWLVLLKGTALVSVINLNELVFQAGAAGRSTREPFTFYFVVLVVYLVFTSVSEIVLRAASHRAETGYRA